MEGKIGLGPEASLMKENAEDGEEQAHSSTNPSASLSSLTSHKSLENKAGY